MRSLYNTNNAVASGVLYSNMIPVISRTDERRNYIAAIPVGSLADAGDQRQAGAYTRMERQRKQRTDAVVVFYDTVAR